MGESTVIQRAQPGSRGTRTKWKRIPIREALTKREPRVKPDSLDALMRELDVTKVAQVLRLREVVVRSSVAHLFAGGLLMQVREQFGPSYRAVRMLAGHIGWRSDWRHRGVLRLRKVGRLTLDQIKEHYAHGMTLADIGKLANRTRERIRQVIKHEGISDTEARRAARRQQSREHQAIREAMRVQHREQRRIRSERRRKEHIDTLSTYLAHANSMWREGATIAMIGEAYRIPANSMSWHMHRARTMLGGTWSPRRTTVTSTQGIDKGAREGHAGARETL